jgi:hypothetical protein
MGMADHVDDVIAELYHIFASLLPPAKFYTILISKKASRSAVFAFQAKRKPIRRLALLVAFPFKRRRRTVRKLESGRGKIRVQETVTRSRGRRGEQLKKDASQLFAFCLSSIPLLTSVRLCG